MTLRSKILAKIRDAKGDSVKASFDICRLLEDEIGLVGNGWFDDDPEMLKILGVDDGDEE